MKLKERLQMGENAIPPCVREQSMRFYFLAAGVFAVGLLMTVTSFSWLVVVSTIVLTAVIAGMGYYRLLEISKLGYTQVQGVCKRIEYTLTSRAGGRLTKDVPKRYIIVAEDQTYAIPYYKHNPVIEEGDVVLLYLKKEPETFEWNNIHTPSVIYGYEILYNVEANEVDAEE